MAGLISRGFYLFSLGVVAGNLAYLAWACNLSMPLPERVVQFVGTLHWLGQGAVLLGVSSLFAYAALQNAPIGGITWWSNCFIRYPSVWAAVLVSLAYFGLIAGIFPPRAQLTESFAVDFGVVVGSFLGTTGLICAYQAVHRALIADARQAREPFEATATSQASHWWRSTRPIERTGDDRVGFEPVVARIASHLQSDHDFSLFLDGPFGSGKSSIISMAWSRVKHEGCDRRTVRCQVSCWNFPTSENVIHFILEQMVSRLSSHVDMTAFRRLPLEYGRAVFADLNWISQILNLVQLLIPHPCHSPERMLSELNRVLQLANIKLVVEIEDLDRTGLSDASLQPVWALLHHLRDADRISVIVAGSSENDFLRDSEKVFEFIETVPELDTGALTREISAFEGALFSSKPLIDCRGEDRLRTLRCPDEIELAANRVFRISLDYALDSLQQLIRTPRRCAQLLRETEADWVRLAGEVDLDDLLITNALRLFARPAFWYVDQFRGKEPRGMHTSLDSRAWSEMIRKAWRRVAIDEASKPAVWSLVRTLMGIGIYPEVDEKGEKVRSRPEYYCDGEVVVAARPQSVLSHDFGDEYWRRIRNRDLGNNPVRDQDLLRLNKDSQSDPNLRRELAVALVGDEITAGRWKRLTHGWPVTAALELADDVINELKSSSAESRRFEALAIVRPRLQPGREEDNPQLVDWLNRTVMEHSNTDWGVMSCLLRRWANGLPGQSQLISIDSRASLVQNVQDAVLRRLRSGTMRFSDCLRPSEEWSALSGTVSLLGITSARISGLHPEQQECFQEIAKGLLELAKESPGLWVGHLVVLVSGLHGVGVPKEWAEPVFGAEFVRDAFAFISEQPIEGKVYRASMWDWDQNYIRGEEVLQQVRAWLEMDAESDQ